MGKYWGYLFIILLHFAIKGCNYASLTKTYGIVVDERTFQYGRRYGSRDIVPYPIAMFKGPLKTKRILKRVYAPEEHVSRPLSRGITSGEGAELLQKLEALPDSAKNESIKELIGQLQDGDVEMIQTTGAPKKIFDTSYIETDEYTTTTPWGAYFFGHYSTGDSIRVIYDRGAPEEGIVCTFFSYWLSLRAICFIILFCIIWTGIYNLATRKVY